MVRTTASPLVKSRAKAAKSDMQRTAVIGRSAARLPFADQRSQAYRNQRLRDLIEESAKIRMDVLAARLELYVKVGTVDRVDAITVFSCGGTKCS